MSSPFNPVKFPLKVAIHPRKSKVLFAEIDRDLLEVLLSFMALPLGKIMRLFQQHYQDKAPALGSLYTLYEGLANLDDVYFGTSQSKDMLLNPRSTFSDDCRNLKINLDDSAPTKYFSCGKYECGEVQEIGENERYMARSIGVHFKNLICKCGEKMAYEVELYANPVVSDEVFVGANYKFTFFDGIQIRQSEPGCIIQNLRSNGVVDTDGIEERTLQLGRNEIIDLLKGLLVSNTPLTELVFNKGPTSHSVTKCETDHLLNRIKQLVGTNVKKTYYLKAVMHKGTTGKVLFAQADDGFVDFLFSLLTIPLGGVANLLNGITGLGGVDNFYSSIAGFDFMTHDTKSRLIGPWLPDMYLSDRQILPISEQKRILYYRWNVKTYAACLITRSPYGINPVQVCDPEGSERCYVKRPGMFMVTDDLTVTPFSAFSTISCLNELKVPLSDIDEVEVEIGVEEALIILKECLTSTAVLTNVVKHAALKKQPKQE